MEALSVLEGERKRHRRRLDSLGEQLNEVKRNVISERAVSLAEHLNLAQTDTEFLFRSYADLLSEALEILGEQAELIHPTAEVLRSAREASLVEDPTDNLILASILDHAVKHPPESKAFLSENRRDFAGIKAEEALRDSGIRYFADASKCWEWHRSRAES